MSLCTFKHNNDLMTKKKKKKRPRDRNPATARLHPSFPSLAVYRPPDSSLALTRGLSSVYLPLHSKTPRPVPPMRNHRPLEAVAHRTIPFTLGLSKML